MDDERWPTDLALEHWHQRRRRRLLFMVGRYVVVMAIILVVAWLTGGLWLRGFALVATALLVLRLAVFVYNGQHLEERAAQRRAGRERFWRR